MFSAIPKGVEFRLGSLTSLTEDSKNKTLEELYPVHAAALRKAGHVPSSLTLRQVKEKLDVFNSEKVDVDEAKRKRSPRRVAYCEVGFSRFWEEPLHATIKRLKAKHKLKWLRYGMSYHRFPNVREALHSDLMRKVNRNTTSRDEKTRECNCSAGVRIARKSQSCIFGSRCREKCVIYRASCMCCNKFYLGRTSQFLKQRFQTHFNFARLHANSSNTDKAALPPSSTFTRHLVDHLQTVHDPSEEKVTLPQVR